MKVGTLCYATDQGIGHMARALNIHGIVTHPVVVRHPHFQTHEDWYPGAPIVDRQGGTYSNKTLEFVRELDAMVFVETPFNWAIIDFCRQHRVRTTVIPMHEWTQEHPPYQPDLWLCVSRLDLKAYGGESSRVMYLPWPVEYPWRCRTEAKVFVHNAGHGGSRGRNGTAEVLAAINLVKSDAKFIVRSQHGGPVHGAQHPRIDIRVGDCPYDQLFAEGDVFIFPEKFCGDSLPLAEARASGMLVMAADRFPMNTWLPQEPLIPVSGYNRVRVSHMCREFDEAVVSPQDIARRIDGWYGQNITEYSLSGRTWAETMSWARWADEYRRVILGR